MQTIHIINKKNIGLRSTTAACSCNVKANFHAIVIAQDMGSCTRSSQEAACLVTFNLLTITDLNWHIRSGHFAGSVHTQNF
jgi:hypothetical protein